MTELIIKKSEIPKDSMVEFYFPDGKPWERKAVLIVNFKDNFYALDAFCTHNHLDLEDGFLTEDGKIVCPWHGSVFDVKSGKVVDGPAKENLRTYIVEVKGDEVIIHE
ncbi:non-heme iron oxygenase ferredoxin subunit [Sulfolobus sp. S-194]|uniref:Rieske (2Fe-2S) protein n=1 Tax=Sulfolobus sp. S-194 TaxID=2512240 RepID=UPI0014371725|nr:Rieske 2Fe-2S domain-containing protein [Sulfolobus sp. S-194]QIW24043.1 non-heme iron oxygenase ferredoxin subunit [Sulfolobus sp. S-194]